MTLHIVNDGMANHNLTIDGTGLSTPMVSSGESVELVVNLPAGDYTMGCDVPGHRLAGMTGVIHVVG